ncbi:MAG: acetolactate synthase large subunit, partial [Phycisphaerae bacterium]
PEIVRKAFKVAQTEKFGATPIAFPEDVADASAVGKPLPVRKLKASEPLQSQLGPAAEVINAARFRLIIVRNGLLRARATDALRRLVDRTRIPCAHTSMAKGALPNTHELSPLAAGTAGNHRKQAFGGSVR